MLDVSLPGDAVERWRRLQYDGQVAPVIAQLAPAAPGWVDSRSNAAVKENVRRLGESVYGYQVVDALHFGDAACVMLLAAWTDKKGPDVQFSPFYMWRVNGTWTYLPNPLVVETWYQSVPDELEPSYARLHTWYEEQAMLRKALLPDACPRVDRAVEE